MREQLENKSKRFFILKISSRPNIRRKIAFLTIIIIKKMMKQWLVKFNILNKIFSAFKSNVITKNVRNVSIFGWHFYSEYLFHKVKSFCSIREEFILPDLLFYFLFPL